MTERILGNTRSKRRKRVAVVLPLALLVALVLAISGSAGNANLTNFEIDGDLFSGVSNVGPTAIGPDWIDGGPGDGVLVCPAPCTPAVVADNPAVPGTATFFRDPLKVDPDPTTFTQGDKENDFANVTDPPPPGGVLQSTTPWHIVSGSVPPQKDDLFDVLTYTRISGDQAELDLGMLRTNNNGDSHVDFELNRLPWAACASNPAALCPVRTEGDLLVSFEISPSGGVTQRFFVWDLPLGTDGGGKGRGGNECLGPLTGQEKPCPWEEISPPLNSGGLPTVITAVNTSDVQAGPWGSRLPNGDATTTIPAGGWFEASLDLDGLGFAPSCPGFGQASAKSRSSSSIPAALMDLAGPFPIDLNTCGKITIVKDTVPSPDPQDFHYTTTGGLPTDAAGFDLDDDADATLSTTRVFTNVTPGSYTVTEGQVSGYALTSLLCTADAGSTAGQDGVNPFKANITLGNLGDVTCTYTNTLQKGAIKVTKTRKHAAGGSGDQPHPLVTFTVNGQSKQTDSNGVACFDNLSFGSHNITETVPSGYVADGPTTKSVTVDNNAACSDTTYVGETVSFSNTPLTNVTVSVDSQVTGGTSSTIDCEPTANDPDAGPGGDISVTLNDLQPQTLTCTIVIDP